MKTFSIRNVALVGLLICLPCLSAIATQQNIDIPVIPEPLLVTATANGIDLGHGGTISVPDSMEVIEQARWFSELINQQTGLQLTVAADNTDTAPVKLELLTPAAMTAKFAQASLRIPANLDEAYSLIVSTDNVSITASNSAGLFYGMTTLWQLLTADSDNPGKLQGLKILDAPRFEWRGLMLDSARHMQSPEFIKRYIDWMSLHKMNVFHWHLTDDQAWRLEIRAFPKLAQVGGFRVPAGVAPAADIDPKTGQPRLYGGYYTQEQVRDIVAHANARHITVVPEIDVPGHATAALAAYPELGEPGHGIDQAGASWGIYNNVFNVEESTLEFLQSVLDEVVELFPGEFIHLGGDEVITSQWENSEATQKRMVELGIEDYQGLQNYYVERLQGYLNQYQRRVIGWDEILESNLPENAAVMSWRGVEGAIEAAAKGHQTVLSPSPTLYLDHFQNMNVDSPSGRAAVITNKDIYMFDPLPDTLADNEDLLLGLQGNLWTEHVRNEWQAAYMTWPRAAALAETAWSAPDRRDWLSFEKRLSGHVSRLESLGIQVGSDITPPVDQSAPRREDRQLELCSNSIVLALEDDAPLQGQREYFYMDVMNPCWIWRDADLSSLKSVSAAVGQIPFNFEIGDDIKHVVVNKPESVDGELNVRLGQCDGPVIASLSLAPAVDNQAVTILQGKLKLRQQDLPERSDLCFSFTRPAIDPLWAIDWVQLDRAKQE